MGRCLHRARQIAPLLVAAFTAASIGACSRNSDDQAAGFDARKPDQIQDADPGAVSQDEQAEVRIVFLPSRLGMPTAWVQAYPDLTVVPIVDNNKKEKIRTVVAEELSKYPAIVTGRYLRDVLVVDRIHVISDRRISGLYWDDKIYVAFGESEDSSWFRGTIHHEISSILIQHNRHWIAPDNWEPLLPDGFGYSDENAILTDRPVATHPVPYYGEQGFFSAYGRTSAENDFNMLAGALFTCNTELWEYYDRYPRMQRKVDYVIDQYAELDARYTRRYFRESICE